MTDPLDLNEYAGGSQSKFLRLVHTEMSTATETQYFLGLYGIKSLLKSLPFSSQCERTFKDILVPNLSLNKFKNAYFWNKCVHFYHCIFIIDFIIIAFRFIIRGKKHECHSKH